MRKAKLPEYGTPEAEEEINLFRSLSTTGRADRAKKLGFKSPGSYTRSMYMLGAAKVPMSYSLKYNRAPVIKESCLVIADTQIPYHDADFLNRLLDLAVAWGIKQAISGGDFLNMTAFSIFGQKPEEKVWSKERDCAMEVMASLGAAIESWLLLMGNHEVRLIKAVAEQFEMIDILALLKGPIGFKGTDYYWCEVKLGGEKWRISHPRNTSVIHGRIPQRLCEKFHANIASGHGHLSGMTPDYSNEFTACDIGITCDPLRLDYYAQRDSIRPAMCQGALILMLSDDGKCHPWHIDPRHADWEALKKCYP